MGRMSDYRKFRIVVAVMIFFLGSAFGACRELQYEVWGRTAEAEIIRVRQSSYATDDEDLMFVTYRFTEEDGTRREDKMVRHDWRTPEHEHLMIEYIPGAPGTSRLVGEDESDRVVIFVVMLVLMVGGIIWLGRPARPVRRR